MIQQHRNEGVADTIAAWKKAIEKLAKIFDNEGAEVQANRETELTTLNDKISRGGIFLAKAFDR